MDHYGPAGRTRGAPARQWPSAESLKKGIRRQDPRVFARGFDPRVSPKQLAGHYCLTREVTRISWVMTRPDPRDFENLLTRPDPTREFLKPIDPTRPDPRDCETPLTRPAGGVMTREKPWKIGTPLQAIQNLRRHLKGFSSTFKSRLYLLHAIFGTIHPSHPSVNKQD